MEFTSILFLVAIQNVVAAIRSSLPPRVLPDTFATFEDLDFWRSSPIFDCRNYIEPPASLRSI